MSVEALVDHFIRRSMPSWLSSGFDNSCGQFVEALRFDGEPLSGAVRVRTIARQIYVYSHAFTLGLTTIDALAKTEAAFDHLWRHGWIEGERGGFASSIHIKTGRVVDDRRQLYDHTCVLLALAYLSKVTGSGRYREHIDEITKTIERDLWAPFGGWADDSQGSLPRQQNPHMHYFEASLAMWETGHGNQHIARAGEIFGLFKSQFWDHQLKTSREFFGPAWEASPTYRSERLDPGHMAEWAWLLSRYEGMTNTDLSYYRAGLLGAALGFGRSRSHPFLADEVLPDGTPLIDRRRLWPQIELLKAIVASKGTADDQSKLADGLAASVMTAYLENAPVGLWFDAFDLSGKLSAQSIPASSLYHLWTMAAGIMSASTHRCVGILDARAAARNSSGLHNK